ncbi:piggyBac transposable element-derived protein 3-like [Ornithodoros turicata]|uniref:piggyBac transposable element-derived protein 3-like n=1 Tax=Ornithodoros turicata TaxID=34597 RepID=UPI003138D854
MAITPDMIDNVVEETNYYSVQTTGKSLNVTAAEVEQFIGLYIMMGLVQMPSVRCYWETASRYEPIANVMSRSRFESIMRFLHFVDNLAATEETKKDKAWKVRPWLSALQENFAKIEPEEYNSVDEIMVSFTGRCSVKQYMPGKPHPWGKKLWGRAGSSGILYQFDVYQGQANRDYRSGLGGHVVMSMCSQLLEMKEYKVAADNFFTSLDLASNFVTKGTGFVGTVRKNRLKDCRIKPEADLKKEGRGSYDSAVDIRRKVGVVRLV